MAVDVETSIEIERPRSVVAAYVSDPDNTTRWYVNIKSVEWKTPPPAVVGSRIAFIARFLGQRIAYTYEVRDMVAYERFVMSTAEGPFPMQNHLYLAGHAKRGYSDDVAQRRRAQRFRQSGGPNDVSGDALSESEGSSATQDDPRSGDGPRGHLRLGQPSLSIRLRGRTRWTIQDFGVVSKTLDVPVSVLLAPLEH